MTTFSQTVDLNNRISHYWLDALEAHHVRYIALDPQHDHKLIESLLSRSEWVVEFANDEVVFFIREDKETTPA
jgi:hypothetical protein